MSRRFKIKLASVGMILLGCSLVLAGVTNPFLILSAFLGGAVVFGGVMLWEMVEECIRIWRDK